MLPALEFTPETYEILAQTSLAAQRPVNWNALAITRGTPDEMRQVEVRLQATNYARERGAEVIALTVPHTATVHLNLVSGMVFDALDGWAPFFRLSIADRMEKLRDREYRANMKRQAEEKGGRLQNLVKWGGLRIVEVFSKQNKPYEGRLIGDIAAEEGRESFDVFAEVALADELRTCFMPQFPEETADLYELRAKLWADSRTVIGASDAGAHLDMINTFSYPTALLESGVRKFKVITLEQAVHHLTQRPAELIGLRDRGLLKTGWHADIVIFDSDKVRPGKLHTRRDMPANGLRLYASAEGIHHVIVNGHEIIRDNTYLGVPAGTIVRPGKDTYTVTIPAARGDSGKKSASC
jgi:N-acyl-D-aspartate/D-glutamate deacylase